MKKKGHSKRDERRLVVKAARNASSSAVRVSHALKLPIQFVKGSSIVEQEADGTTKLIKEVQQVKSRIVLTKGTKICLKSKD